MQVKVLISKGTCSRCNKVELLISHLLYIHLTKVQIARMQVQVNLFKGHLLQVLAKVEIAGTGCSAGCRCRLQEERE